MSSQNDCVWLALHAGELTRQQLDALDLTLLRSFEPKGMGYAVEMFKSEPKPEGEENEASKAFINALYTASERFYGGES